MAGRRQASVGEDKPSPTKVAAVTAPSKKSERPTAPPAALRPLFFSSPKIEIMFTTGRTQPGVPCRHLLLLPVALCGPSAGRIFALSGRLLGFLPVYFCVRFSLVFSLSAFGRRARFGPSGAIFSPSFFLRALPALVVRFGCPLGLPLVCAPAPPLSGRFPWCSVLRGAFVCLRGSPGSGLSFVFSSGLLSSRRPFLCFFCFPWGLPFLYFFCFSPGSVLCFISFVFFGYFRFVVISLYIFILFLYFFICPPIDMRKGRVDVGTIYPLER